MRCHRQLTLGRFKAQKGRCRRWDRTNQTRRQTAVQCLPVLISIYARLSALLRLYLDMAQGMRAGNGNTHTPPSRATAASSRAMYPPLAQPPLAGGAGASWTLLLTTSRG